MFNYTVINHVARIQLDLTMNEYAVADIIYHYSNNPKNPTQWCFASKKELGEQLNLTEQSVHKLIKILLERNLIEKHQTTHNVRTTLLWYEAVINKDSTMFSQAKESLATLKKVEPDTKESLAPIYSNNSNSNTHTSFFSKELNEIASPLCRKKKVVEQCKKCAYCSRTVMTPQQLYEVAVEERVPMSAVKTTYQSILNQIQSNEFKHKTVYFALKNWINMGRERGNINEIGQMELDMMKMQYDQDYINKLKEARARAVEAGLL